MTNLPTTEELLAAKSAPRPVTPQTSPENPTTIERSMEPMDIPEEWYIHDRIACPNPDIANELKLNLLRQLNIHVDPEALDGDTIDNVSEQMEENIRNNLNGFLQMANPEDAEEFRRYLLCVFNLVPLVSDMYSRPNPKGYLIDQLVKIAEANLFAEYFEKKAVVHEPRDLAKRIKFPPGFIEGIKDSTDLLQKTKDTFFGPPPQLRRE